MQAQSMLGDAEIVAGRQGDAMNFEHEDNPPTGERQPSQKPEVKRLHSRQHPIPNESSSGDELQLSVP